MDERREHLIRRGGAAPLRREREHSLRLRCDRQVARLGEGVIELIADGVERDPEVGKGVALTKLDVVANIVRCHVLVEGASHRRDRQNDVLDVEREGDLSRFVACAREDQLCRGGGPPHQPHQRRPFFAYFWCTACFVTPSSSAICCHEYPRFRASVTWMRSTRSSSRRNADTARSPVSGSPDATCVAKSRTSSTWRQDELTERFVSSSAATHCCRLIRQLSLTCARSSSEVRQRHVRGVGIRSR